MSASRSSTAIAASRRRFIYVAAVRGINREYKPRAGANSSFIALARVIAVGRRASHRLRTQAELMLTCAAYEDKRSWLALRASGPRSMLLLPPRSGQG